MLRVHYSHPAFISTSSPSSARICLRQSSHCSAYVPLVHFMRSENKRLLQDKCIKFEKWSATLPARIALFGRTQNVWLYYLYTSQRRRPPLRYDVLFTYRRWTNSHATHVTHGLWPVLRLRNVFVVFAEPNHKVFQQIIHMKTSHMTWSVLRPARRKG